MSGAGLNRVSKSQLMEKFLSVRATTERLCEPLEVEDFVVQSMPDEGYLE
jgi:hypothetical protein